MRGYWPLFGTGSIPLEERHGSWDQLFSCLLGVTVTGVAATPSWVADNAETARGRQKDRVWFPPASWQIWFLASLPNRSKYRILAVWMLFISRRTNS